MTYIEPLLAVFGLAALMGLARVRGWLLMAGIVGLILCGWPPVEWLLSRPLEARYAVRPFRATPGLQAVVVFSSGVSPPLFERPYPQADYDTAERCGYAAWVYRQIGPVPVLACGGGARRGTPAFAVVMRDLLRQAGVPENMIWTEEKSGSTHENARFGAEILRSHGIDQVALAVDARSMPRAAAALEKEGIRVTPAPSQLRQWEGFREVLPGWKAIRGNEATLHETLG
ncbi:MAG: YdcF family protein [Candidatus Solibacter sp.]|nr:YdcF family protein [Candidatus Solibacter sp.]